MSGKSWLPLLTAALLLPACDEAGDTGGDDDGGGGGPSGSLVAGFDGDGSVIIDPTANGDLLSCLLLHDGNLYVGGLDEALGAGTYRWRIEKRRASDGGLVAGFGSGGVVTVEFSGGGGVSELTTDGAHLYAVGSGGGGVVVQRRSLTTGALEHGVSLSSLFRPGIHLQGNVLYVFADNTVKLSLPDLTIVSAFGGPFGLDTPEFTTDATAGAVDGGSIFVARLGSSWQWRLEKRSATTAELDTVFGSGTGTVTSDLSAGVIFQERVFVDASGVYQLGTWSSLGHWRVEKRDATSGDPVVGFGDAGILKPPATPTGTCDVGLVENDVLWLAGSSGATPRLEKRSATTGALDAGFGSGGGVERDVSGAPGSRYTGVAVDAQYVYVVGFAATSMTTAYSFIEKRRR